MDRSNRYEAAAPEFLARRGRSSFSASGAPEVCEWARAWLRGVTVIDLGYDFHVAARTNVANGAARHRRAISIPTIRKAVHRMPPPVLRF